ncbi:MAG: phosphomannomutase/phosphoglucomutase [Clostridia bacterium]
MNKINIFDLKSGTDIRGTAISKNNEVTLTDEVVAKIAKAFAVLLKCKVGKNNVTIAVGHDSRISAERLKNSVCAALAKVDVKVISIGLCSTPSMFMITKDEELKVDGSIMLTASHHPSDKNGLKFFTSEGGVDGKDINEILEIANTNEFENGNQGQIVQFDYMPRYCQILIDKVREKTGEETPLKGFKIVVDAGNGAGGFYADKVLKVLGADTTGSQFLNPDGNFPNHIPNPENEVAMQSISKCVLANHADLGVIFDTDVDRAAAVGRDGRELNRNKLIAVISAILLKEERGGTIVTDSITSIGLKKFIIQNEGIHHRFKRGYKNVIDEAIRLNKAGIYTPLAIETSGHAALKENYFLDDGAYLVTRLIIEMAKLKKQGKELTDLIADLEMPKEEIEIRMGFKDADFKQYGLGVLEDFRRHASEFDGLSLELPNFEGVRVNFDENNGNGWLLLRMSLHDPIMPLNIESNVDGGCQIIARKFYEMIKAHKGLNVEELLKYIG